MEQSEVIAKLILTASVFVSIGGHTVMWLMNKTPFSKFLGSLLGVGFNAALLYYAKVFNFIKF
jgi:hypothetical protein